MDMKRYAEVNEAERIETMANGTNPLIRSRMFRAAIQHAVDNLAADPRTMAAVDQLAEPFLTIGAMLEYLWTYPGLEWGEAMGLEYSQRRQAAALLVTGNSYSEWCA